MPLQTFILTLECPDRTGIVAAVSTFLADRDFSIEESHQFHDAHGGQFFMRTGFSARAPSQASLAELESGFAPIARRFGMQWRFHDAAARPKVLIAVSRHGHCLFDLMQRVETGWLRADVVGVASNHEAMAKFAAFHQTPYHFIPVTPETKPHAEARLLAVMRDSGADLLVLARYMQVLSPELCAQLAGRCINIHHSFLPSFKGANPYAQAHARGVKIIGATAHYVTPDLDEGPIIEQQVTRVAHHHTARDLMDMGRDLECAVLARAVRWHLERRVMISGPRTIVFA